MIKFVFVYLHNLLKNMIKKEKKFKWLEEGSKGEKCNFITWTNGGVENFGDMVNYISKEYKVYGLDFKTI